MSTPLRVLLVEDNADDARLVVDTLTEGGFAVASVRVETEVGMRDALARQPWDVVLCDYRLPHFDARTALEVSQSGGLDLPFIIVSGTVGEEIAVEAMRAGAHDYVMKDRLARLPAAVARELREAAQRRRRRSVEEALRQSEERFRGLVETSTDWIWELNEHGIYVYVSPRVREALGFLPAEVVGKTPFDFMPPEEAQRVGALFGPILAERQPFHLLENVNRHKNGGLVVLETSGVPIFDPAGTWRGYRGIDRDITGRKQAEAALRESEEKFRLTTTTARDGIIMLDSEGRVVFWNDSATAILGYSRHEVMGRQLHDWLVPERYRTASRSGYAAFRHTGQGAAVGRTLELSALRKDGVEIPVELSISATRLKDQWHAFGIMRDITARKETERRLREQAEVLDKANEAIVVSDLADRITFWSRGAERLSGWTSAEMLGRPVADIFALGEVGADAAVHAAFATFADWRGEIHGRNRAGASLVFSTSITVLRGESGQPIGRLSISTDITEAKKLHEQFLRAQRLESLGMLAAGIAHDLNNVLAPIRMAVPLLRAIAAAPGDHRLLDTLEKSSSRGADLVQQILGFAHGIGGEPRIVQVKHLLRDVVQVMAETFPKSISLENRIPSDLWPVLGNPTQIHQVLLNLCVNARDAMPNGGRLRLLAENDTLDASRAAELAAAHPEAGVRAGDWLVLHVEDSGTGIPADVLPRIWEPFFTTKEPEKGTGLGLSTVRGIVESHRGFVTVETAPGQGAAFRVYLPATESSGSSRSTAPDLVAGRGHGEPILLVDDEEPIRETAAALLKRAGYHVTIAADGAEAALIFSASPAEFALVITDLDMPRLDGASLARVIRSMRPEIKILAMSGLVSRRVTDQAADFSDAFLAKPFSNDVFLRAIQQLLAPVVA
ncbi:MAG: PAS domain S-box protein [Opitutae bacterium]|nr:PAS domain S-box protein [Opitutae bacterium]